MMNRLGQQIGNYRLIRLLGQGGFSEVYLGKHVLLETTVAIKVLHTQVSQKDVAQFLQEARILASLKHPHIVHVLDFGLDRQTPYLVMDYAPNGTLRTRHPRGSLLPVSIVVGYIKQLAEALQYAHDRKVVHRDIKPENMLIDERGEILLSDFGIALILQSSHCESAKEMVGTVAYMAPEQIEAHPRPSSDQYSLGVVAYEWLSGKLPFHGSFAEIAVKHRVTRPPSLRERLPTLSAQVEHVVLTALAKQPEARFTSVSAFAIALEQASQDMLPTEQGHPAGISPSFLPPLREPATPLVMVPPNSPVPIPDIQTLPVRPDPPVPDKMNDKPTIPRRVVLTGGAISLAVIAAVGAGVLVATYQQSSKPSVVERSGSTVTPRPTVNTPALTVTPQNQLFTYRGHSEAVRSVAWSPDGQRMASGSNDGTAQVWDASDGKEVKVYRGQSSNKVNAVAWSPDGKYVASAGGDKTVQVWNANNLANVLTYNGHTSYVYTVAWSPDGQWIASGSADATVQVWNASDGSLAFTYQHSKIVRSVAWSPNGQWIASCSDDGTVQVWNVSNTSSVYYTYTGHSGPVNGVTWSVDGKRIASGSSDNTVQVWDFSNGGNVYTYRGHSSAVDAVAWSPDGKSIASGSKDGIVRVWNASDGSLVYIYKGHTGAVSTVAWSPTSPSIASGSGDNTVQVWRVR